MDQRATERVAVDGTVTCQVGGADRQDSLRDLSTSGCKLLSGGEAFTAGTRLEMTLLSGIEVAGTVRWANGEMAGIEFDQAIANATVRYFTLDRNGRYNTEPMVDSFGRTLPPLSTLPTA